MIVYHVKTYIQQIETCITKIISLRLIVLFRNKRIWIGLPLLFLAGQLADTATVIIQNLRPALQPE